MIRLSNHTKRAAGMLGALALLAGCAPTLHANQSFLTAEDLKLSEKGFASFKSTGETMDLGPIRLLEGKVDRVVVHKVHGTLFLVGEGFHSLYRLWPGGDDELHYKPVNLKLDPLPTFSSPALEAAGKCVLFSWKSAAGATEKRYVTAGGDFDSKGCPDA